MDFPDDSRGKSIYDIAIAALKSGKYKDNKDVLNALEKIKEDQSGKYKNWILDTYANENDTNGLKAIAVSTGSGHGVVAYAGTEGMFMVGKDQTDMIDNINMMSPNPTDQQLAAQKFLEDLDRRLIELGKQPYDSIDVTGHSKGGNNALFASLMVNSGLAKRINRVVTYNAPGFSKNVVKNFTNLSLLNEKITQFRTPGDLVSRLIKNKDIGKIEYVDSSADLSNIAESHYLHLLIFNGDNVAPASGSIAERFVIHAYGMFQALTVLIQDIPEPFLSWVVNGLCFLIKKHAEGAIEKILPSLLMTIGVLFILCPGLMIGAAMFLATVILAVVVLVLVTFMISEIYQSFVKLFKVVKDMAVAAALAIASFYERAKKWLDNFMKSLWEGIKNLFGKGKEKAIETKKYVATKGKETIVYAGSVIVSAVKITTGVFDELMKKMTSTASDYLSKVRNSIAKSNALAFKAIKSIFGSASSAISAAGTIAVTISRVDDMQRRLNTLRTRYLDAKTATNNARTVVSRVSSFYNKPNESYVRNCCRDIDNEIKNAQKFIDTAERNLNKRRTALVSAIDSYRKADQNARQKIRATGFA